MKRRFGNRAGQCILCGILIMGIFTQSACAGEQDARDRIKASEVTPVVLHPEGQAEDAAQNTPEPGPGSSEVPAENKTVMDIETIDRMNDSFASENPAGQENSAVQENGAVSGQTAAVNPPAGTEQAAGGEETGMLKPTGGKDSGGSAFAGNTVDESIDNAAEGMPELKDSLMAYLSTLAGDWSVYVEDLSANTGFQINDHQVRAASLIKLFVMGTVFDQIQKGNLAETDTIDSLLNSMITVSDNEATNELVCSVAPDGSFETGKAIVNAYIQEQGYMETILGRTLGSYQNFVQDNLTSARDCGLFMSRVYRGTCVSPEASARMLDLLRQQTRRHKIPAGVPQDVLTANKTGELDDTENDSAILVLPDGHAYVLTVTSTALTDVGTAQGNIVSISSQCYEYMASHPVTATAAAQPAAGSVSTEGKTLQEILTEKDEPETPQDKAGSSSAFAANTQAEGAQG